MDVQVENTIKSIPLLSNVDPSNFRVERLGGLTNQVYHLSGGDHNYCLRIPGAGTDAYIDRKVEKHNALVAEYAGVSPKVHYFSDDGVMLTEFIPDSTTMSPETFQVNSEAAHQAGESFRQLHECDKPFQFRFEVFAMIEEYLQLLSKGKEVQLPDGYHEVVERSKSIQKALDSNPVELAPCHCDPLSENFIQQGSKMWIVDWEYSGMNDPYWDLGDLSVEAGMSESNELTMLRGYFGRSPTEPEIGRMVMYKALCDLLWTLWGLIQHMNDNPVEDFWAYSIERFTRCVNLVSTDDFSKHMNAIRR